MTSELPKTSLNPDNPTHEQFMELAFDCAEEALKEGEVPVGCVIVYKSQVIAKGRNYVNDTKNSTLHAEIVAIDRVYDWCDENNADPSEVFKTCSLYVNVEPCIMCASALQQIEIPFIAFACANDRFGGCGSVVDVFKLLNNNQTTILPGIKSAEAIELLKAFYQGENPNAPNPKIKGKSQ